MGQAGSTASQNVLMLGLDGSGKSSILARLLGDDPRTVLPTYGFTIRAFQLGDTRERAVLKLWDQGGTAPMRRYWPAYYAKAHALCFVIDASDHRHQLPSSHAQVHAAQNSAHACCCAGWIGGACRTWGRCAPLVTQPRPASTAALSPTIS